MSTPIADRESLKVLERLRVRLKEEIASAQAKLTSVETTIALLVADSNVPKIAEAPPVNSERPYEGLRLQEAVDWFLAQHPREWHAPSDIADKLAALGVDDSGEYYRNQVYNALKRSCKKSYAEKRNLGGRRVAFRLKPEGSSQAEKGGELL